MFASNGYAAASRKYAAVDAGSRIEGATPHALVKILFDELLLALDASTLALRGGDERKARDKQVRALTLLHALDSSLDFEQGGEIAFNLAVVYREVRRRLIAAIPESNPDRIVGARDIIAEIADAWNQIA